MVAVWRAELWLGAGMGEAEDPWVCCPGEVVWTSLGQACGCVVDWAWSGQREDAQVFMGWCVGLVMGKRPCPWHDPAQAGEGLPDCLLIRPAGTTTVVLHARKTDGPGRARGQAVTARLERLLATVAAGELALWDEAPPALRSWLMVHAADPGAAWLEQQLAEILLDTARVPVSGRTLDRLGGPMAGPGHGRSDGAACTTCAWAAAHDGMLCTCGHDWLCHPGHPAQRQPCAHCDCADMHHA